MQRNICNGYKLIKLEVHPEKNIKQNKRMQPYTWQQQQMKWKWPQWKDKVVSVFLEMWLMKFNNKIPLEILLFKHITAQKYEIIITNKIFSSDSYYTLAEGCSEWFELSFLGVLHLYKDEILPSSHWY